MSPVVATAALAKAGKLRVIAVSSAQRLPGLPEVPTIAESGVPGFEYGGWNGILVPTGTPGELVARLHGATVKAASTPEFRETLACCAARRLAATPNRERTHGATCGARRCQSVCC
jgi:tripartite-type tricarboxylate transporter receptor subunit TctC